jgi:hypothetical protein
MSAAEPIRLQKYLADSGLCSRRAAEALIAQGEVWVNGTVATLGQKVTPGVDRVTASGKSVRSTAQPRITLAMNKPRGLACTNDDPHNRDTVFDRPAPRVFALPLLLRRPPRQRQRRASSSSRPTEIFPSASCTRRASRYQTLLRHPEEPVSRTRLPLLIKGIMYRRRAAQGRTRRADSPRCRQRSLQPLTCTCITAKSARSVCCSLPLAMM